ncbi:MAG: transposase domain-containing protein [Rhodanobacter sp.]|jgi:hypothetical protein|nr:transposase domain-containing protein [Rhodanobacter sp.]
MARTLATLPQGSQTTDHVSLGVITKTFPLERVRAVLAVTGKSSVRERELPAHVIVYYVIALALYMQSSYREVLRCLLEGLQWLSNPTLALPQVTGSSGITQARTRVGNGDGALIYLGRYLYRGVIREADVFIGQDGQVGFRYRDS